MNGTGDMTTWPSSPGLSRRHGGADGGMGREIQNSLDVGSLTKSQKTQADRLNASRMSSVFDGA